MMEQRILFTIGHSNYSLEVFVELLKMHAIEVIVDVRSNPYSRYATHFTGAFLKPELIKAGFKYLFMGREIGGKPGDQSLYDDEGYVDYNKIAATQVFREGIQRLETGINKYRVAIMCGEEDPSHCHRRNLIGKTFRASGVSVIHIRKGGVLQSEEELMSKEMECEPMVSQLKLFG